MKNRTQWVSVFMALAMPGLGQVYNGELIKGCCILVFFSVLPLLLSWIGLKVIGTAPLIWAVLAVITGLLVYILAVAEAFRRRKERPNLFPSAFQTRLFYLAFWLVAMIFIAVVQQYIRDHLVEAYRIVSHSMSPTVLAGDYVLVDKVFYERGPVRKGDIVIHVYPDDRSKDFIRQVVALPGDALPDRPDQKVPHGTILVRGVNQQQGVLDSANYGPVELRDIVGKVAQIYFSRGPDGIRWGRIGEKL